MLSASAVSQEAFLRQRGSLQVEKMSRLSNIAGVSPAPTAHHAPLVWRPCWEARAGQGAILWSLRAGARRQAAGTRPCQRPSRGPADEAVALLVMGGKKSISKRCRADCFSAQQARGQQVQQPHCNAPRHWMCAQLESCTSAESRHPGVGIFGCLDEPQFLPSVLEGTFAVATTSAAKDYSHDNTPVSQ